MNVDVEFILFIFIFFCYIFLKDYIESVVYSTGARQKGTDQQGHNQKPEINTKFGQCGVTVSYTHLTLPTKVYV